MGHVSRSSTKRYAHMAEGALRVAAAETHATHEGYRTVTAATKTANLPAKILKDFNEVGRQGLEPWTYGLKARSSTD